MGKKIDPALVSQAQYMRVMQGKEYHEIAKALGIHEHTVASYSRKHGWDDMRRIKDSSSMSVEMNAVQLLTNMQDAILREGRAPDSGEVDAMYKLRKMIESLNKDLSFVTNGIEAVGLFMKYLREKDEELFKSVIEHSVQWTEVFAKKYTRRD